jgi:adenylate cyclase
LRIIEKHLELHPDDARALYLGAAGLFQVGQRERALEWARRALSVDPDDPMVLYNVACSYALLGLHEDAISCPERVMAKAPLAHCIKSGRSKIRTLIPSAAILAFRPC